MFNLLATKLHLPRTHPKRVPRPLLLQRLNDGLESGRQIFLISAPAGFGKTTCLTEWLETLPMPVTWLSLDLSDDDPGRFFTYLIAALQKIDETLGQEIAGILRAGQLPPLEIVSATLINDIQNFNGSFLLVLDDFQVIQDRFILDVMAKLVENLPQPLYLALLTRQDPALPLARLRANNLLTEIRAADLRFTRPEARQFLNTVMGLTLSDPDIALLEERTEGWIAGLHLAGLSIRERADPSAFIASLSGSHHFILSYLTEEVLNRQPAEIQQFLLQTSILTRLSGDLCDAVTGRTDSHLLLKQLHNANLFLIPLDDEQRWYRYHQLFADLLRALHTVSQKDQTAELQRRASRWYEQAGMPNEAIQHALAAEDYALALRLLESYTLDMLLQWHLKTVEGWMQAIPPSWIAQRPKINLVFAWMHLLRGSYPLAAPYLVRLQALFADPQFEASASPSLRAEWLALQSTLLNAQGQAAQSVALANRALEIAPAQDVHVRGMIYMGMASAYRQLDDYENARDAFQMLIQHGRAAANLVSELLGLSGLGLIAIQRGQLRLGFDLASQGLQQIERSGVLPPLSTALYGELGAIHYHWRQLDQAHYYFQRAIQVGALSGYSDAELYYGVILSRLYHIQGDMEAANRQLEKTVNLMHAESPAAVREEVIAQQVCLYLAQDRLPAAEAALKSRGELPAFEPNRPLPSTLGLLYNTALRILLYRAHARHERTGLAGGIDLAGRLLDAIMQRQYIPLALETLLLRAQLHAVSGNCQSSLDDYLQAIDLARPEGFISVFIEEGRPVAEALAALPAQVQLDALQAAYLEELLAAFPAVPCLEPPAKASRPPAHAELIEPLSARELEILQLIGEGLSNQEIAARLVVTLHTIKKHTSNIYAKLSVDSRTQAIARARRLGLLE